MQEEIVSWIRRGYTSSSRIGLIEGPDAGILMGGRSGVKESESGFVIAANLIADTQLTSQKRVLRRGCLPPYLKWIKPRPGVDAGETTSNRIWP